MEWIKAMLETLIALVIGNPVVIAIAGGFIAVIAAFLKGRKSGKNVERTKQLKRDARVRDKNNAIIDAAQDAAHSARVNAGADGLHDDDGYRRD